MEVTCASTGTMKVALANQLFCYCLERQVQRVVDCLTVAEYHSILILHVFGETVQAELYQRLR